MQVKFGTTVKISYLRKLKYQFPKITRYTLYCTYKCPLLEYASEVWHNCTNIVLKILRKLKYQFPKSTVNMLYCTYYIRPLLEYASEVWHNVLYSDSSRIERVQRNAAGIVTGLPLFSSKNSFYLETGWKALADRRKNRKLTLMYKIVNADAPAYLTYAEQGKRHFQLQFEKHSIYGIVFL